MKDTRRGEYKRTVLQEYLEDNNNIGNIDHSVRISFYKLDNGEQQIGFYIHPQGTDGETLDFIVRGNSITPAYIAQSLFDKETK